MKTRLVNLKKGLVTALGCLALTCMTWGPVGTAQAQSDPANLPPGVQDVLKLTRAGLSEDLILTQVRTSGATYSLTADQIIFLSNQGVSQNVIKALMPADGSAPPTPAPTSAVATYAPAPAYVPPAPAYTPPAEAVAAPAPDAPPPVSLDYFQAQLQPYGRWVNIYGVGLCWVPAEGADPAWRPYFNSGHWVYTEQGWFWQSDYAWGEIAFHYGRWFRNGAYGWVWAPGYDWAPAWVSWRYAEADGCCGWAPLPLEARFDLALGLCWRGGVALDVDFGLPFDSFVFIGFGNFWVNDYRTIVIGRDRARFFYARSVIHNGYRMDHGRFVCEGFGRERMAQLTHHDIRVGAAHELRAAEEHRNIERRVAEHHGLAESAQRHVAAAAAHTARTSATQTHTTVTRTGTTTERNSTFTHNAATTPTERTTTPNRTATTTTTGHPAASGWGAASSQGGSTRSFSENRTTTTTTHTSESTATARTAPSSTPTRATMNSFPSGSAYGSHSSSTTGSGQAFGAANSQSRSASYGASSGSQRSFTPSSGGGGSSKQSTSSSSSSSSGKSSSGR